MLGSKIRRREKRISALLRGVFCFPSVDWECMLRPLSLFETRSEPWIASARHCSTPRPSSPGYLSPAILRFGLPSRTSSMISRAKIPVAYKKSLIASRMLPTGSTINPPTSDLVEVPSFTTLTSLFTQRGGILFSDSDPYSLLFPYCFASLSPLTLLSGYWLALLNLTHVHRESMT
jgi:hypothetical protein